MPITKAQQKSVQKYVSKNYDRHVLTMRKGRKAKLRAIADKRGTSLNGFLNAAIDDYVERLDISQKTDKESQAQAWREFLNAVGVSSEYVPEAFERVNFTRELKL